MPYMYSEMQNKLPKTRELPLESMGQIISSRCPYDLVSTLAPSFFIGSCSFLQVRRTTTISGTSLKFVTIRPRTAELAAL